MERLNLLARVRKTRRRSLLVGIAAGVLWSLALASGLLLAGVWLDLLWQLSPQWRIAVMVSTVVGGAGLLVVWSMQSMRGASEALVARQLDRAVQGDGVVLSGWELALAAPARSSSHQLSLTAGLATMAIQRAAGLAGSVSPGRAISTRPLHKALAGILLCGLTVGLLVFCLPSMAHTEWNRFTNLSGDIAPFTPLQFEVDPGDTKIVYGDPLEINVGISGGSVERVELILLAAGRSEEALPMFPESDGTWRAALSRVTEPATYYVRAGRARSSKYQIEVITVPRIEAVRFRVKPPAYTRDAIYEGQLPKGGLSGLPGTQVTVWAKSNRPLSGGLLTVWGGEHEEQIAMQPTAAATDEVTATFTIRHSGKFQLHVVDEANQESRQTFAGTIVLKNDTRPMVRLLKPRATSLATPHVDLPILIAAGDDYGIRRLQVFRSLNDSRPLPIDLTVPVPAERRIRQSEFLPLSQYDLVPGDTIKLFARVEDNDPAGAKGAESTVVTVHIISQEEFERMVRRRQGLKVLLSKYRQARRRMEKLAEELKQLQKEMKELEQKKGLKSKKLKQLQKRMRQLAEQMVKEAQAIERSAQHLLPYDLDKNRTEQLRQLVRTLRKASEALDKLASQSDAKPADLQQQLGDLARELQEQRRQFEQQATQPLEHLEKIYPLLEDQQRFVALVLRQRDLAERLSSLKDSQREDNPAIKARMRDLEEEQRRIREELDRLLGDIENHVTRLPDEEQFDTLRATALKFVDAVRASGAAEAMADAETALAEFVGSKGYEKAKEAADILEKFLSQCNGMGDAAGLCLAFNPSLSQCLGNTVQQLLAESMGMGSGSGQGGGSGSSARRGANVGLYGGLPTLGEGLSGGGQGDHHAAGDPGSIGGGFNPDEPTLHSSPLSNSAGGTAAGSIPHRYRTRVGQYFQRIIEETTPSENR